MDMEINFPNLGIYLDHVGKNISIFGFSIAYYGIVIVTGMMIAIWIAQREAKRTGQNPEQYLDLAQPVFSGRGFTTLYLPGTIIRMIF